MKKHFRQILATVLALTMVLLYSFTVQAQTVTKPDQVLTLYSSSSLSFNDNQRKYAPANETVLNTNIYMNQGVKAYKSSNTSVVNIVYRKLYPLYQYNPDSYSAPFMNAKKTGTTVISFKDANNTYKEKVTVKKYVNPFSTLKIGSLNLTSKFKTNASYTLSYNKYKNKNLKLQVKAKNGWTVEGNRYITSSRPMDRNWIENGKTFKVTKRNSSLVIYTYNQKTKQSEQCLILFK